MNADEKHQKEVALRESLLFAFSLATPLVLATGTVIGIENGAEWLKPTYGARADLIKLLYGPCIIGGTWVTVLVDENLCEPLAERTAKRICRLVLG
jgi:hypothetical protein